MYLYLVQEYLVLQLLARAAQQIPEVSFIRGEGGLRCCYLMLPSYVPRKTEF